MELFSRTAVSAYDDGSRCQTIAYAIFILLFIGELVIFTYATQFLRQWGIMVYDFVTVRVHFHIFDRAAHTFPLIASVGSIS